MSLVNARNFLAPFKNVVNIVTIVVIALLFGIYRLAGGGIKVTPHETARRTVRSAPAPQQAPALSAPRAQTEPGAQDEVISNLLAEKKARSATKDSQKNGVKTGGLDDIEKQLGLR